MIAATAISYSIYSRRKYPTFKKWWDAEGLPIWIVATPIIYLLLT